MLTEDGKHLYVSYDEYNNLIEKLAIKVHQSGWEFDTILCLARGGMRPGDILSRVFDKPLAIMSTSSYRSEAGTVQGALDIAHYIHDTERRDCRASAAGGRFGGLWTHPQGGGGTTAYQLQAHYRVAQRRDLDQGVVHIQA